jgi:hypothetical protein
MELTAAVFGLGGPNVAGIKLPFGGTRRRCSELFPDKIRNSRLQRELPKYIYVVLRLDPNRKHAH